MRDIDTLKRMLDAWGVEYEEKAAGKPSSNAVDPTPWMWRISIGTDGKKNIGYGGFVCEFYFDDDGMFQKVGVWE